MSITKTAATNRHTKRKNDKTFCRIEKRHYICTAFEAHGDLVAQQVEHIPFKDGVLGSSPSWITDLTTAEDEIFGCFF